MQEGNSALLEQPGCLLVVVVQTWVGEQMARTWVEEQFCALDLLDQRPATSISIHSSASIVWICLLGSASSAASHGGGGDEDYDGEHRDGPKQGSRPPGGNWTEVGAANRRRAGWPDRSSQYEDDRE